MTRSTNFLVRRWQIAILAILIWCIFSLGWNSYLIKTYYSRLLDQQLSNRAEKIVSTLRDSLPPRPAVADPNYLRKITGIEPPPVQIVTEKIKRVDPDIAYVMIWTHDGIIVTHSRRDMPGQPLDVNRWPALQPSQPYRIVEFRNVDMAHPPEDVTEITEPLQVDGVTVGLVSIGYRQTYINAHFWETERKAIILAGVYTLAGAGLILLAIHFASDRLDRYRREIQQSAQARTSLLTERGMLASVLAHEVRSPLTALRFNLYSLRTLLAGRSADTDRQVELTDRCEREIRRLDGMLNDFLQRTQVIGHVEDISINAVVREAVEFLRPALERRNVRPNLHLDPTNPRIHVHPDELRQVILNLAANVQDAMPRGGTLALSTVKEPNSVALLIRDSGTGIPPELHQRIFEPFFSTKPNGSGLGLALVRRVVSGAGGTIFCESAVGEGTTFRIVLPSGEVAAARAGTGYAHQKTDPNAPVVEIPEIVINRSAERADPQNVTP